MFADESSPSGTAQTIASTVPHSAICNVMMISLRYIFQSRKFGGKKSAANCAILPDSRNRSSGRMSAPCHDHDNTASTMPQPSRLANPGLAG